MTKEQTLTFTERNAVRREARKNAESGAREARRMRRVRGGAFGQSANHIYNMMVPGTTAERRPDKGDDPGVYTVKT